MTTAPGATFRHGTVRAGGFTLDYAEAGPADAEVTLVSFPGSAGIEMSTAKDDLARRHRVVEINPPGWGGREDLARPMPVGEIGTVLGEAANQLVDGTYFIIGTSMGGVNAIHAAAQYPDRVRGVILEGGMAPAQLEDLIVPPPVVPENDATAAEGEGEPAYPVPPFDPRKPWATEEFVRTQMENRFKMFRWVTPEFLPEEALARVADSKIPVLALLGDQDEILRPTQAAAFAQYLPHADFQLVPGGPHDLQNILPEEFVTRVERFIAS
jgi:pimeloyl-ACP methyl ester carboxylesterase